MLRGNAKARFGRESSGLQFDCSSSRKEEKDTCCLACLEGKNSTTYSLSSLLASSSSLSSSSSANSSKPKIGVDRVVSPIVYEKKREEGDMASNLRVEFRESQCKRLSESISISPSPSKKPCLDAACLEPTPVPVPMIAFLTVAAKIIYEPDEKLHSTEDIAHHEPRRLSTNPDHFSDGSLGSIVSSSSCPKLGYIPNREEIAELMRQIPSFTKRETLVHDMRVLFPTAQWISIEIANNLDRSFTACLSYGTLDTTISHIMPMRDYTAFETVEVVGRSPFLFIMP